MSLTISFWIHAKSVLLGFRKEKNVSAGWTWFLGMFVFRSQLLITQKIRQEPFLLKCSLGEDDPFLKYHPPPHLNCLSSQIGCETGPEIPSKHDGGLRLRLQKCTEKKKLCANCKTTGQILLYLGPNTYSEFLLIALWNRPYHESNLQPRMSWYPGKSIFPS